MYFIWDFTQLNVRPHSRVGLLKYKTAPKWSLSGPFRHSGVGRNPGAVGPVRSYNLNFIYPCHLREEAQQTRARIFFADEAHFRADAELRGKWVLKGKPALVDSTSPRYGEKASYYSAVCLGRYDRCAAVPTEAQVSQGVREDGRPVRRREC